MTMMNDPIFVATLGQRPQAITMALDHLREREKYAYRQIEILHTDLAAPEGVGEAHEALMPVLSRDYGDLPVEARVLSTPDGEPLADINDLHSADHYFRAVVSLLRDYRIRSIPIHLLVAGGRKAMSIYATLAASLLFGEHDHVWTILTTPALMETREFHIPPGRQHEVEVVSLPVRPSRLLPGVLADIPLEKLLAVPTRQPHLAFLEELTTEERALIETLREHPYASNKELGGYLNKSYKTIENQFGSIYTRLSGYYQLTGITPSRKREVLLNVIHGRV